MTKENKSSLEKAVADAKKAIEARSYYGRNPHLGRMINCAVCGNRHRGSVVCEPRYAKFTDGSARYAEGPGRWQFAKKRFHPHPNKKSLQLVELTRQIYPDYEPYLVDPVECMKAARLDAQRLLKKQRRAKSKIKRQQQKISRRINFGLLPAGSR